MWETLGIGPTTDIREIKSAYAKLAKQYNPEEKPEEFKRIFDAYKAACEYARNGEQYNIAEEKEQVSEELSEVNVSTSYQNDTAAESEDSEYDFSWLDEIYLVERELSGTEKRKLILNTMREIISDEHKRNDKKIWENFFALEELDIFIFEPYFRKEAANLVFGVLFSREAAQVIASGFGRGSESTPVNFYPVAEFMVTISEGGKNPPATEPVTSIYKRNNMNSRAKKIAVLIYISVCAIFMGIIAAFMIWDYNFRAETAEYMVHMMSIAL